MGNCNPKDYNVNVTSIVIVSLSIIVGTLIMILTDYADFGQGLILISVGATIGSVSKTQETKLSADLTSIIRAYKKKKLPLKAVIIGSESDT